MLMQIVRITQHWKMEVSSVIFISVKTTENIEINLMVKVHVLVHELVTVKKILLIFLSYDYFGFTEVGRMLF